MSYGSVWLSTTAVRGSSLLTWESLSNSRFWAWSQRWKSNGCWEWWWRQRRLDKCTRKCSCLFLRNQHGWMDGWMDGSRHDWWGWRNELIPKTRWCISKWAICDFQWGGGWWSRNGDRWGADIARGLNREDMVGWMVVRTTYEYVRGKVYIQWVQTFSQWRDLRMGGFLRRGDMTDTSTVWWILPERSDKLMTLWW